MRWFVFVIAAAGLAEAQERPPYLGELHAKDRNSTLRFFCQNGEEGTIDCEFSEARLRPSLTEEEIAAEVKSMREEMPPDEDMSIVFEVMAEGFAQGDPDLVSEMDEQVRAQTEGLVLQLLEICGDPSDERVESFQGAFVEDLRTTCTLEARTWSRSFAWNGAAGWVVSSQSPGGCGAISADRWTQDGEDWLYTRHQIVTNPEGAAACRELDEDIVEYRPERRQAVAYCAIVEMGHG